MAFFGKKKEEAKKTLDTKITVDAEKYDVNDFDDDILDRRKIEVASIFSSIDAYSDIYLEQAVELADLIFDNNLDKVYFLRQYIKSFEKGTKPFARAKRPITATNIPKN